MSEVHKKHSDPIPVSAESEHFSEPTGIEVMGISSDDSMLVDILLNPEDRSSVYMQLVGESPKSERKPWDPELQELAKQGMVELVLAEFAPQAPEGDTIEEMRKGLAMLDTQPEFKNAFMRAGRRMEYQNMRSPTSEGLSKVGDFLHFGVNVRHDDEPDVLPSPVRVYVNSKPEYSGHVAAEVIKRARQKGYEPVGKIWDDTTNMSGMSTRTDRVLFLPRTQTQLDAIMESLEEIQTDAPDMFEDRIPMLVEPTGMSGVGLAEEPKTEGKLDESFNGLREQILVEAWDSVIDHFMGVQSKSGMAILVLNKQVFDRQDVELRDAIVDGRISKAQVIPIFRKAVAKIAPTHGVSADNFARNAA